MSHTPINKTIVGRQFANFRILRLLGRGGMAEVYYGWDVKLDRPVAIKVIDARYRNDPEYSQRFVNEARAMAAWHHPNIIPIFYADDEDGYSYYVMEYIHGLDLEQVISEYARRQELMPLADVIRIGRAAAQALDYAHRQGVIHRDVKPSNLLISAENRAVLTDFGIAMNVQLGTMGEVFGSPHYIAPEQARRSSQAVPQSDLYSLGVILYEMLVGARPFDDPSPTSLAVQHLTQEPPSPRWVNPDLSPAVEAVLVKALSKSPQDRYSSGKELIDALEAAISTPPETSPFIPAGAPVEAPAGMPLRKLSRTTVDQIVSEQLKILPPIMVEEISAKPGARSSLPSSPLALIGMGCGILLVVGILTSLVVFLKANLDKDVDQANALPRTLETQPAALPFNTWTPLPQRTSNPQSTSAIPSQTAGVAPTQAPSVVVQNTPTPAPAELPAPTATAPSGNDGDQFVMYYNDTSFYMKNLSGKDRSIYPIAFERLDKNGDPTNRFDGWRWGNIYSNFRDGYCLVMEVLDRSDYLDPPECRNRHLVIHRPPSNRDYIFWTKDKDSKEFRVLWDDAEVGLCSIKEEFCEVYLP